MKRKLRFFKAVVIKVCAIFALVTVALNVSAQKGKSKHFDEAGLFLGVGYYNGEINPSKPFYRPKLAIGLNLRHGFNERVAANFQVSRCKLEGADRDFTDEYRRKRNAHFENEVIELAFCGEYNFFPLEKGSPTNFVTPYVSGGLGITVASFPGQGLRACIPFGVGVKISPNNKVTIAFDWKYRKLFSDMLDQISDDMYSLDFEDAAKQKSFGSNDDWYSFVGVILSFNLGGGGNKAGICPAYK
ncbi:MAG: outer membrane beta-barrel protein [Bacteroidales bacterium]|nr:outer membrane beta-barrel protein [Bacteroidales bacterium]